MDTGQIITKLKECILEVGVEFNRSGGDARFWNEADIQQRLLAALWSKQGLTIDVSCVKTPSGQLLCFKVPLAHSERYSSHGARNDLVVFDADTAERIVVEDLPRKDYVKRIKERPRLAVIEIKNVCVDKADTRSTEPNPLRNWREGLKGDLEKGLCAVGNSTVAYAFMMVFVSTASLGPSTRSYCDLGLVTQAARDLTEWKDSIFQGNRNCSVFWASDHPDDPPRFL
jgi:hypothetical protein